MCRVLCVLADLYTDIGHRLATTVNIWNRLVRPMIFPQGYTLTFVGKLDGAQWSVDIWDVSSNPAAWVPAGTLTGSEYISLSILSVSVSSSALSSLFLDQMGDHLPQQCRFVLPVAFCIKKSPASCSTGLVIEPFPAIGDTPAMLFLLASSGQF